MKRAWLYEATIAATILTAIFITGIWVGDKHRMTINVMDCQGKVLGNKNI